MADWKYEYLCSVALSKDLYPEFLLNEETGKPEYEPQDRLALGLYGLYGLSIDNDTKQWSIVFVPTSDLNKADFSKTFSPAVQVVPQGSDGSARAEPYTLALSHDETRLALAFPPPSESGDWCIDIHATSNLRAGVGRAIVSLKLPHDVRLIRWARVGGKEGTKFLVGGKTELTALTEGQETTTWNKATRPPVEGNPELGWADWGWEGDLIAVSYFGQRAESPPESKFDPTFVSPGRLELVRPSTWSVVKSLPCVVRDARGEPVGADQVDPATGKSFLHGPDGTDDQTFATRFDRRNMVHVEWVHRDLLVAVSRCSDVGAVHSPVTTHYQLDTDELDPAVISPVVANESARFHVAYLAATKLLAVGVTQSTQVLMSDLSEPVLTLQELEQSRKSQPRPVGEPVPDFYSDADEDDSFCVGLGMLPVCTELGKIPEETGARYRPLLIAVSATGRLHFFALYDGTSARAERIAVTDPIPAPPAVPTPQRLPPTPTPPPISDSFKAPVAETSTGQAAASAASQAQAVGGGGSAGTSTGQPSPFSFPSTASSKPSAFAGSTFSFGGDTKTTAAPAPSRGFSASSFGGPTTSGTSAQKVPTSSAPAMSSFDATWNAAGAGNRLGGGLTIQPPVSAPAPSIKASFAPSPTPAPAQKASAPWSSGAAAAMPLPRDDDDDGKPATVNTAAVRERDVVVKREAGGENRRQDEPRRDHEKAHTDDEQLAEKALRALPGTPGAPQHTVRAPSGAAAKSGGGSEVDKAWEELLKLAEHRETGVQDPALQLLKDPNEQAERTNAMTQLKRWTQDLVDRVELWEAETDKLEEQVVTLYGKLPELKRLIHDFELMKADEDERRQAETGERGVEVNRAKPWEADYLDAFACEQREKLEEQVEELAREIGSLMGPNQRGFGISGASKVAEEQRRRRQMAQRFGVDGQEQIRRAEREAKLLKKELQFLEGQLRADPATSDQLNRYLRQVSLSKRRMSGAQSEDAMVVESVFDADLFTTEVRQVHEAEMILRHELGMFRAANDAEIKQGRPDPLLVSVKRSPLSEIGESREAQLAKLRAKQEDRVRKNMEHVASYGGAMISTAPRTTAPPPSIAVAGQRAPPPAPASAPTATTRTASQAFSFTGPPTASTTSTTAATQPPRRQPSFVTLSSAATAPSSSTSTSLFQQPKPESASVKPPASAPSPAPASQASTAKPPPTAEAKAPAPAAPLPPMSMKAPSTFQMPGATAKPPAPAPAPSAQPSAVPMPPWPSQAPKPPSALMGAKPASTTTSAAPTTTTTSTHTPAFDFSNLSLKSTKTDAGSTAHKALISAPAPAPAPANSWSTGSSAFGSTTGGTSQPATSSLFSPPTATQTNKPQAFSFPSAASTATTTQPTTTTATTTPAPETPQKPPAPAPSTAFQSGGAFGQATGGSNLFKGPSTPSAGSTTGTGAPSQAPAMGSLSLGGLSAPQSQQQQTQTPATGSAGTAAPSPFATPQKPSTGSGLFGQAAQGGMSGFSAFSPQQQQQPQTPVQQQAGGAFGMGGFGGQQQQQAVGGAGFPPPGATVAQRLRMFYQKYAPDKAAKADQFAEKYKAEVPKMWATLFQKYPTVPQSEYQMWFPEYQQAAGAIPPMPGGGGAPPPMPTGNTGGAGYAFGQRGGMGLGTGIGSSPGATGSGFSSFANKGSPFSGATGGSPFGQTAQPFGSPAQAQQQPSGFGGGMFAQGNTPFGGGGMQMGGQQQQQPTGFGFAQPQQQQQQQTGFGMFGQQQQQPTGFGFGPR